MCEWAKSRKDVDYSNEYFCLCLPRKRIESPIKMSDNRLWKEHRISRRCFRRWSIDSAPYIRRSLYQFVELHAFYEWLFVIIVTSFDWTLLICHMMTCGDDKMRLDGMIYKCTHSVIKLCTVQTVHSTESDMTQNLMEMIVE